MAGQKSAGHYIPVLKRIQEAGKGLIIMAPPSDVPILMSELSSKGSTYTEAERMPGRRKRLSTMWKHIPENSGRYLGRRPYDVRGTVQVFKRELADRLSEAGSRAGK